MQNVAPQMNNIDYIHVLADRIAFPQPVAALARNIHFSAIPTAPDSYTAACALYMASIAARAHEIPQLPLPQLLNAADSELHVPEFLLDYDDELTLEEQRLILQHSRAAAHPPDSSFVHPSHTAFMVTAQVWRQFAFLLARNLFHNHPLMSRVAWLFFLVAKASLSSPTESSLTHEQAYHLLLSCLVQSGFIAGEDPIDEIFRATRAVPHEIQYYQRTLGQVLHTRIRSILPLYPAPTTVLESHCHALNDAYSQLLTNTKHTLATDERIFLHCPQLANVTPPPVLPAPPAPAQINESVVDPVANPPRAADNATPSATEASSVNGAPSANAASSTVNGATSSTESQPSVDAPSTEEAQSSTPPHRGKRVLRDEEHGEAVTPRPRRRKRAADYAGTPSSARPPTPRRPRTRSAIFTNMSTPHFSRYAVSTHPDALDALATVAAVTPHSAVVLPATPPSSNVPLTTSADRTKTVRWIRKLTETRPETRDEGYLKCPLGEVPTTDNMNKLTGGGRPLRAIIDVGRRFSEALCEEHKDLNIAQFQLEALAVYFAAMEGVLEKEQRRLSRQPEKFHSHVLHNYILHKSFLTFAWETTIAAHGRRDLKVFMAAYEAFNVSPFELTKALDTFCTLVPHIPRCLVNHLICCDARILERMAWIRDSPLVLVLQAYGKDRDLNDHQSEEDEDKEHEGDEQVASGSPVTPVQEQRGSGTEVRQDEQEGRKEEDDNGKMSTPRLKELERPERLYGNSEARERVLGFFYEKVFRLAGTRVEDLLRRLDLKKLRDEVWRGIKYALWCRWNLVINRHVDLIILCVIYGVAKVRHIPLQFRQILWHYNQLDHTNDATFHGGYPASTLFRDIPLDDFGYLLQGETGETDEEDQARRGGRGDLIRFYNEAFVPHMRDCILQAEEDSEDEDDGNDEGRGSREEAEDGLDGLARQASRRRGREREEMFEDLGRRLLQSPMRPMRRRARSFRIGSVVVSPMSPSTRSMVQSRQNSIRRSLGEGVGVMTPGTRTLFAFGESPPPRSAATGGSADGHTRRSGREERHGVEPLVFDGPVAEERSAAVRREVQEVIGRSGREVTVELDMRSSEEESEGEGQGDGMETEA